MKSFAVGAPFGIGGLGRHLQELVDAARADDSLARYYCSALSDADPYGVEVKSPWLDPLCKWSPARFSIAWRAAASGELFDRRAARVVEPVDTHVGFSLHALNTFRQLREAGAILELVAPTSHIANVRRQHEAAYTAYPIERPWINSFQVNKAAAEYRLADRIVVASDYVRESFEAEGFDRAALVTFPLTPHSRYRPIVRDETPGFGILYVGSLTVHKGVPLLIDAFRRFERSDARLTLVGGWSSRQMRRHIEQARAADPRITVSPGDPLRHVPATDLYVHPSYEDGWAYAAAEAQACGLPVVVTEDTGAKQLVRGAGDGLVIPTGDRGALLEAMRSFSHRGARTGP